MQISTQSKLTFIPAYSRPPGTVCSFLEQSYREILQPHPRIWAQEREEWAELDRLAQRLHGNWIFLTQRDDTLVGLASFDPRPFPKAIIGHNCVLPQYRGLGYGKQQMQELLRVISSRGFKTVMVTTGDHPFFIPAQRMYFSCGFREVRRDVEPPRNYMCKEIQYQLVLDNKLISEICRGD